MPDFRPRFASLKNDSGRPCFCGPGAIAIVTGENVWDISQNILTHRRLGGVQGKEAYRVTGMAMPELSATLKRYGLLPVRVPVKRVSGTYYGQTMDLAPTLTGWLKLSESWRRNDVYLIMTTDHFLLISGNKFADNITKKPVPLSEYKRHRRARVYGVYCILKP